MISRLSQTLLDWYRKCPVVMRITRIYMTIKCIYIIVINIGVIIVITESLTGLMFLMVWLYFYVTYFVSVFRFRYCIILQEAFHWNRYLSKLGKKLNRSIGLLSKLRHYVPEYLLRTIYLATFNYHLIYAWKRKTFSNN